LRAGVLAAGGYRATSLLFVLAALLSIAAADIAITAVNPWAEMQRLVAGVLRPDFPAVELRAIVLTVAFAVLGVSLGAGAGFLLALAYADSRAVRFFCGFVRSIHELFWALLLIQIFGLSPTTGILAIGIPYAGIFAKVFAEMIEEADTSAERALPPGTGPVSAFLYARLPVVAEGFKTYGLYRFECAMRSTLVLGFIGLPTIGFHLESYFKQGQYAQAAAFLIAFYALIGTRRLWARAYAWPVLIIGAVLALAALTEPTGGAALTNLARFAAEIVPRPLRGGDLLAPETWARFSAWFEPILWRQILPGAAATLVLAQIALVLAAILALVLFPLTSRCFAGLSGHLFGRALLVVLRSTPEYMLAYLLLQLLGPSMLPAIAALALHNGGIIGYLMGRHADAQPQRLDAPRGLSLYAYETVPRLYGQFLAYCLYRWEIILRESAIFGMLGVATLGYHVDAAISELRLDVALLLLLATAALSMSVDALSQTLRRRLRIERLPTRLASDGARESVACRA
jgi:phosphonate transport system permease protein